MTQKGREAAKRARCGPRHVAPAITRSTQTSRQRGALSQRATPSRRDAIEMAKQLTRSFMTTPVLAPAEGAVAELALVLLLGRGARLAGGGGCGGGGLGHSSSGHGPVKGGDDVSTARLLGSEGGAAGCATGLKRAGRI
jgi:hypothetical protein